MRCNTKTFLNKFKGLLFYIINNQNKPIKVKFVLSINFSIEKQAEGYSVCNPECFNSNLETITDSTDFYSLVTIMLNYLVELVDKFQKENPSYQFISVEYIDIDIGNFESLSGSSYIPLPKELLLKRAIINVKNYKDNECFK